MRNQFKKADMLCSCIQYKTMLDDSLPFTKYVIFFTINIKPKGFY